MKSIDVSEGKSLISEVGSSNKGLALVTVFAAALAVGTAAACSTATQRADSSSSNTTSASQTNSHDNNTPVAARTANGVPRPLEEVGHYAENIYDMAKASDWTRAANDLATLRVATQNLGSDGQTANLDRRDIEISLTNLERDIASRNRLAIMQQANRLTMLAANMTRAFNPQVPTEVTLLDYYGRELEIGAETNNVGRLRATAADMRRTWNLLLPALEARGGSAEARKFGELVTRVEAAQTTADFGRFATPVLDEVDNLEKVFTRV